MSPIGNRSPMNISVEAPKGRGRTTYDNPFSNNNDITLELPK